MDWTRGRIHFKWLLCSCVHMLNTSPAERGWHYGNQWQISRVWKMCFRHLVCFAEMIRDFERVFPWYRIYPDWQVSQDHSFWGSEELIVLHQAENLFDSGVGRCGGQIESEQCIGACVTPIWGPESSAKGSPGGINKFKIARHVKIFRQNGHMPSQRNGWHKVIQISLVDHVWSQSDALSPALKVSWKDSIDSKLLDSCKIFHQNGHIQHNRMCDPNWVKLGSDMLHHADLTWFGSHIVPWWCGHSYEIFKQGLAILNYLIASAECLVLCSGP
jgi:hypothetical protein